MVLMVRPAQLRAGDAVAVVAPAGPLARERFEKGAEVLRGLGLRLVYDERLFARDRYLAGPDAQRLSLLQAALDDPTVTAVWSARGGYGLTRLLPQLRLRQLRDHPKLVIGFSDVTALHAALGAVGVGSLHGPNVGQVGELTPRALARLKDALFSWLPPEPIGGAVPLRRGKAQGVLLGGNLTLLASLVGTPHLPSFAGSILLLEDVGEAPYRIDRALTQLRNAGAFEGLRGLALGTFVRCDDRAGACLTRDVLAALAIELAVPAAIDFPIGHLDDNCAVPLGAEVELDANEGKLTFFQGWGGGSARSASSSAGSEELSMNRQLFSQRIFDATQGLW